MRIFYAVGSRPHGALLQSKVWYYNLYLPLYDLGHDLVELDYDLEPHYANADDTIPAKRQFNEEHRPRLENELIRQISEAQQRKPIDLFLSYFYSSFVRPEVIREISRMGIMTVNWYCNASYQFNLIETIAPAYDFCLVPEKFRLVDYRRVGAKPLYCQEAANPNIYKPYPLAREYDVTFVGAQYGDRADCIKYLIENQIDTHVWGPGWISLAYPHSWRKKIYFWARRQKKILLKQKNSIRPIIAIRYLGKPLSDAGMIKMYSRSKISLGFSNVEETHCKVHPIKQVRLRDFEAPMSGGFYLLQYMEEIEEFFTPDREIVCYHDKADLIDKVKYYLTHDTEREKIRKMGHKRAINEHSWQRRLQDAFKHMGFH